MQLHSKRPGGAGRGEAKHSNARQLKTTTFEEKNHVAAKKKADEPILIKPLNFQTISVPIVGTSPLLMHKFSDAAKEEVDKKRRGENTGKKNFIKVDEEIAGAIYYTSNGKFGFPAAAFKNAMIRGGSMAGFVMTKLNLSFRILGEDADMVELKTNVPRKHTAIGRNPNSGGAVVIHRPEFEQWEATLKIRFDADVITQDQIVNLLNRAGETVGVGDWRLEKKGNFGAFMVKRG